MRRLIYALMLVAVVAIVACSKKTGGDNKAAAYFAKGYYERLIEGNYEGYVDALNYPDSIPPSYRRQLVLNAKLFTEKQKSIHGGWVGVEIAGCVIDSLSPFTASARRSFIIFCSSAEYVLTSLISNSWRSFIVTPVSDCQLTSSARFLGT